MPLWEVLVFILCTAILVSAAFYFGSRSKKPSQTGHKASAAVPHTGFVNFEDPPLMPTPRIPKPKVKIQARAPEQVGTYEFLREHEDGSFYPTGELVPDGIDVHEAVMEKQRTEGGCFAAQNIHAALAQTG